MKERSFKVVFLDYNNYRLEQDFTALDRKHIEEQLNDYYGWGNTKIISINAI